MSNERLRDAIRKMTQNVNEEVYSIPCEVASVDTSNNTCVCSPVNGDSDLIDVRLQAGSGNGVLMIPKEGSIVMVTPINEVTGFVSMYSEIESIQFLDGSYGGLIKIDEIVNKLNAIEDDINTLKQAFTTWVTVPNDGGAALKAATATWYAQQLQSTTKNQLENELITHGNK